MYIYLQPNRSCYGSLVNKSAKYILQMAGHCDIWKKKKKKKTEITPVFLKFSLKDILSCANLSGTALVTNLNILGE